MAVAGADLRPDALDAAPSTPARRGNTARGGPGQVQVVFVAVVPTILVAGAGSPG